MRNKLAGKIFSMWDKSMMQGGWRGYAFTEPAIFYMMVFFAVIPIAPYALAEIQKKIIGVDIAALPAAQTSSSEVFVDRLPFEKRDESLYGDDKGRVYEIVYKDGSRETKTDYSKYE